MASMGPPQIELIAADLKVAQAMFAVLDQAAAVEGVQVVTITYRGEAGDVVTVGYGEQAEPAIVGIQPAGGPVGRCCENGNFFDGHQCRKQEG